MTTKKETMAQRILAGIGEYWCEEPPVKIEVVRDPKVSDCFAARTYQKNGTEHRWLLCFFKPEWTAKDIADNLEECDTHDEDGNALIWPPPSGHLQFF